MEYKTNIHHAVKERGPAQNSTIPHSLGTESLCEVVLKQFRQLHEAIIDASSMIYMKNGGFWDEAVTVLELYAPEAVIEETGFSCSPVGVLPNRFPLLTPDDQILVWAVKRRLPIISEDKKILRAADQKGLHYFNALMILHFLLFKEAIWLEKHASCFQALKQYAWYDDGVLSVADRVYRALCDQRTAKRSGNGKTEGVIEP